VGANDTLNEHHLGNHGSGLFGSRVLHGSLLKGPRESLRNTSFYPMFLL